MVHASQANCHGFSKVMIHTTDTDVVVLGIAVSEKLANGELWIAFGHGSKLRYILSSHCCSIKKQRIMGSPVHVPNIGM